MYVVNTSMGLKRLLLCLLLIIISLLQASCSFSSKSSDNSVSVYPPFLQGKRFLISQAFNSNQTHNGLLNRYAVDFIMPLGEPVCAVAAGKVISVKTIGQGSHYVRIQHANSLISDYQHLLSGSIQVEIGDQLANGYCFAKVGNTGSLTGPHLHFSMLQNLAGVYVSKPFKFISPSATTYTPRYLKWVYN